MSKDAIRAVEDAIVKAFEGRVPEGIVLRVDNGPQYIAQKFRSSMKLLRIALEYIQKHTPEDNGNIESFHSSLKTDYVWPFEFQDYREASVAIESAFTDYNEKCKRRLIFPQKRRNKIPQLYLFFYSSFFTSLNVGNEFFFLSLSL